MLLHLHADAFLPLGRSVFIVTSTGFVFDAPMCGWVNSMNVLCVVDLNVYVVVPVFPTKSFAFTVSTYVPLNRFIFGLTSINVLLSFIDVIIPPGAKSLSWFWNIAYEWFIFIGSSYCILITGMSDSISGMSSVPARTFFAFKTNVVIKVITIKIKRILVIVPLFLFICDYNVLSGSKLCLYDFLFFIYYHSSVIDTTVGGFWSTIIFSWFWFKEL